MALDTGSRDLIVDQSSSRVCDVKMMSLKTLVFWDGARVAVQNAVVQRLELGGLTLEDLPAGVVGLRKWSLEVNPQAEPVAGVIGLGLLRQFTPTLDYGELWRNGVRRDGILSHDFFRGQRVTIDWERHELVVEGKP